MDERYSIAVAAVGLALVALLSIAAFFAIWNRFRPRKQASHAHGTSLYEDEDGTATGESQAAFSTLAPRIFGTVCATAGLGVSVAASVLSSTDGKQPLHWENWIALGSWALLTIQVGSIFIVHNPTKRFRLGLYGSMSSVVICAALVAENALLGSSLSQIDVYMQHFVLALAQAVLALATALALVSFARRPTVYQDEKPVDAQFTVSALSRYSFTWASPTLNHARTHQTMELEELPKLPAYIQSSFLEEQYMTSSQKKRLWKSILYHFRWPFFRQNILILAVGVAQFAPQFAMFNLLKLLENRTAGAQVATVAWAWVIGLGLTMIVSSWIESWLFWTIWSELGVPIQSLLSILVFTKATRRKDVKGVQNATPKDVSAILHHETVINEVMAADEEPERPSDDENETQQKSRQSTINLIGVDSKRVSDFASYAYIFPGVAIKLTVSMWFLYTLIGWKSLLAGLVTFALSLPINVLVSKKYNNAQGDLMKLRDQKMAVVTEALQGIRQIKFSALERQWQKKIESKRNQELATQWKVFAYETGLVSIWISGPVMLSAVALSVYSYLNGDLSASIAFTTIAVLGQIEGTLSIVPELTTDALDAWVSINRIEEYLNAPEKSEYIVPSESVSFENAAFAWPSDSQDEDPDRFILREVNLRFPANELSVISGPTGSGKSLLLAAILGEADRISGAIKVPRAQSLHDRHDMKATKGTWILDHNVAFVAQIPWVENATIKDNILFGLPCDDARYRKVLSVCALVKDLDMLPDGESTDIGANGINLSGGQRWRVSFARALYSRAGILILDDIFSAVDAHVGRQLFEEALTGELGMGRTRILVTHHVTLCLPKTKYAVLLGDGTVKHAGSIENLQQTGSLDAILDQHGVDYQADRAEDANDSSATLTRIMSRRSEHNDKIDDSVVDTDGNRKPKRFIEDEKRETGSIKLDIYTEYIKISGGLKVWIPIIFVFAAYTVSILGRSWWVSIWTRSYRTENIFAPKVQFYQLGMRGPDPEVNLAAYHDVWYYLGIYIAISVAIVLIGTARFFFTFVASIRASRELFRRLTYTVLRAPLRWLDTIPVGRILNRFTSDFNIIDSRVAPNMAYFFYQFLELIGVMVAGFIVSPYMIIFAVLLLLIALFVAQRYLSGAREVKRIQSNAKSPIFEQFGSTLAGIGTVRAFDKVDEYVDRMLTKIDNHSRALWHIWLFNRWMGFRLNLIGAVFAIFVAAIIVASVDIDASLAGFALAFALQYTDAILWTLRCYANVEMDMNATERIVEYTRIPTEDQTDVEPPAAWPTEGRLEVRDLVVGYAADLPAVLNGLSFDVETKERIGVVGRTGAGKSSLTLAIFRFLEAREGSIYIDGVDIAKIGLHALRSRLAIIPQDPVLFSGTVRSNLDAFDEHGDAELYDALERVQLIKSHPSSRDEIAEAGASGSSTPSGRSDANTNIFKSLASKISEGGLNLSQGQRQLLCLARAIISRPKIMVLDEATSAVDMATDVLIQRSIRAEFGESTLLVIAHRLSTIVDFDRILVMSDGKAVEYDTPANLLKRQGVFWEMVLQSGEKESLQSMIWAGEEASEGAEQDWD